MKGPTAEPTTKLANRYPYNCPKRFIPKYRDVRNPIMSISVPDARPRLMMPATGEVALSSRYIPRHGSRKKKAATKGAKILSTRYPDNRRPVIVERPTAIIRAAAVSGE